MRVCEGGGGGQFQLPAFLFLLLLTLTSQDVMLMDKTKRHTAGSRSISQPPEGEGVGGGRRGDVSLKCLHQSEALHGGERTGLSSVSDLS